MRHRGLVPRIVTLCAALALGVYCLGTMPARADTPPAPGGYGAVTSGVSSKCLDDFADSSTPGAVVDLYQCDYAPAQDWNVNANSTLEINGLCLDVNDNGTSNGDKVQLWNCNGGANQVWVQQNGALVNPQSGRCLDDPGGSSIDGTQLQLWDCNGGANQEWSEPGGYPVTNPGGDLVISMDDGGVDPSLANEAINVAWPEALGLGAYPSAGNMMHALYQHGVYENTTSFPPPPFTGGSISVSGSTITVDIPASALDADPGTPDWLAGMYSQALAWATAAVALGACAGLFNVGITQPLGVALCVGFATFWWNIVASYMTHLLLNTPDFSWVGTLFSALTNAFLGASFAYAGASIIGVAGTVMAPVRAAALNGLKAVGRWLGDSFTPVYNAVSGFFGTVVGNWGSAATQAAAAAGLDYPSTNASAYPSGVGGLCLDAYATVDSAPNGNIVDVYPCNGQSAQNSWTWYYGDQLTAFGRCLDVANDGTANGSPVQLWECNGGGNQKWTQVGNEIVNEQSGRCLDDPGLSTTPGTQLVIWDCNGGPNQQW